MPYNAWKSGCYSCGTGKFQDSTGASSCKSCPSGKFQNQNAQTGCKSCSTGWYSTGGTSYCNQCPTGKYLASATHTYCTNCPGGKYQDQVASTSCKSCSGGKYQNSAGQTKCKRCQNGKFQDSSGASYCKNCPSGQFTSKDFLECFGSCEYSDGQVTNYDSCFCGTAGQCDPGDYCYEDYFCSDVQDGEFIFGALAETNDPSKCSEKDVDGQYWKPIISIEVCEDAAWTAPYAWLKDGSSRASTVTTKEYNGAPRPIGGPYSGRSEGGGCIIGSAWLWASSYTNGANDYIRPSIYPGLCARDILPKCPGPTEKWSGSSFSRTYIKKTCYHGEYCRSYYGFERSSSPEAYFQQLCRDDPNCNAYMFNSRYGYGYLCRTASKYYSSSTWSWCKEETKTVSVTSGCSCNHDKCLSGEYCHSQTVTVPLGKSRDQLSAEEKVCRGVPPCTDGTGSVDTGGSCVCNRKTCGSAEKYCNFAENMCSTLPNPTCQYTNGQNKNPGRCLCGDIACEDSSDASSGLYCTVGSGNKGLCVRGKTCGQGTDPCLCANILGILSNPTCDCGTSICASGDKNCIRSVNECSSDGSFTGNGRVYQKIHDGECWGGTEIRMYEGSGDNPGTDELSRVKACADACLDKKPALSGSWSGFVPKGFIVTVSGRCYCENIDSSTCSVYNQHAYDRYDFFTGSAAACDGSGLDVPCICDRLACADETKLVCSASGPTCQKPETCANLDLQEATDKYCTCGRTACTSGQYCSAELDLCSDIKGCNPDGLSLNDYKCQCGTAQCNKNSYCLGSSSLCFTQTPNPEFSVCGKYKVIDSGLCADDLKWTNIFDRTECQTAQKQLKITSYTGASGGVWTTTIYGYPRGCLRIDSWSKHTSGYINMPYDGYGTAALTTASKQLVCKRREFIQVNEDKCDDYGGDVITDSTKCAQAGKELGLSTYNGGTTNYAANDNGPYGCMWQNGDASDPTYGNPKEDSIRSCGYDNKDCLCEVDVPDINLPVSPEDCAMTDIGCLAPLAEIVTSLTCAVNGYVSPTQAECEKIAEDNGMSFSISGVQSDRPTGCFTHSSALGSGAIYWNPTSTNHYAGHETANFVCKSGTAALCYEGNICPQKTALGAPFEENLGHCMCGSRICNSEIGLYCSVTESGGEHACNPGPDCENTDGTVENPAGCSCGNSVCNRRNGLHCFKDEGFCSPLGRCENEDGTIQNQEACICGTSECGSGLWCLASHDFCAVGPECEIKNGAEQNTAPCRCGSTLNCEGLTLGCVEDWDTATGTKARCLPQNCPIEDGSSPNEEKCMCGEIAECGVDSSDWLFLGEPGPDHRDEYVCYSSYGQCTKRYCLENAQVSEECFCAGSDAGLYCGTGDYCVTIDDGKRGFCADKPTCSEDSTEECLCSLPDMDSIIISNSDVSTEPLSKSACEALATSLSKVFTVMQNGGISDGCTIGDTSLNEVGTIYFNEHPNRRSCGYGGWQCVKFAPFENSINCQSSQICESGPYDGNVNTKARCLSYNYCSFTDGESENTEQCLCTDTDSWALETPIVCDSDNSYCFHPPGTMTSICLNNFDKSYEGKKICSVGENSENCFCGIEECSGLNNLCTPNTMTGTCQKAGDCPSVSGTDITNKICRAGTNQQGDDDVYCDPGTYPYNIQGRGHCLESILCTHSTKDIKNDNTCACSAPGPNELGGVTYCNNDNPYCMRDQKMCVPDDCNNDGEINQDICFCGTEVCPDQTVCVNGQCGGLSDYYFDYVAVDTCQGPQIYDPFICQRAAWSYATNSGGDNDPYTTLTEKAPAWFDDGMSSSTCRISITSGKINGVALKPDKVGYTFETNYDYCELNGVDIMDLTECSLAGEHLGLGQAKDDPNDGSDVMNYCTFRPATTQLFGSHDGEVCSNSNQCVCRNENYFSKELCQEGPYPICVKSDSKLQSNCWCNSEKCSVNDVCNSEGCQSDACFNEDGVEKVSAKCQCGTAVCKVDDYCHKESNVCSQLSVCSHTDGRTRNNEQCQCGTAQCVVNSYCNSLESVCNGATPNPTCDDGLPKNISGAEQCDNGYENIKTWEECKQAAEFLEFEPGHSFAFGSYPYGCLLVDGIAYFNSETVTDSDAHDTPKICQPIKSNERCQCAQTLCQAGYWCVEGICSSKPRCIVKDGSAINPVDCTCGSVSCSDPSLFCYEKISQCSDTTLFTSATNDQPRPVCSNKEARVINNDECLCGRDLCEQGEFCLEEYQICSNVSACGITNGLFTNGPNECMCGTNECSGDYSFCVSEESRCAKGSFCTETDGKTANSGDGCMCGTTNCEGDNMYCLEDENRCAKGTFCEMTDGILKNLGDGCMCGTTNCEGDNMYCLEDENRCAKGTFCTETDGKTINSGKGCMCGASNCEGDDMYCHPGGICKPWEACENTDGTQENPNSGCFCKDLDCVSGSMFCETTIRNVPFPFDADSDLMALESTAKCKQFHRCENQDGTILNNGTNCFCGNANCYKANSDIKMYCHARESSVIWDPDGDFCSTLPKCSNRDRTEAVTEDCACGKNDECSAGQFCDGYGTCHDTGICHNKDGSVSNSEKCECHDDYITATNCQGNTCVTCPVETPYCYTENKRCSSVSDELEVLFFEEVVYIKKCSHTDGITAHEDSSSCRCGETAICDAAVGMICDGQKCSKQEECAITNGVQPNDGGCRCGTTICSSKTGYFCSTDVQQCSKNPMSECLLPDGGEPLGLYYNEQCVCTHVPDKQIVYPTPEDAAIGSESFKMIDSGTCSQDTGWHPIHTIDACEKAAEYLNLPITARTVMEERGTFSRGCTYDESDKYLRWNSEYKIKTSGKCTDDPGYMYITDAEECDAAKIALALDLNSNTYTSASNRPIGCIWKNSLQNGYVNSDGSSVDCGTDNWDCFCKRIDAKIVTSGTCESNGMVEPTNQAECEAAAIELGLGDGGGDYGELGYAGSWTGDPRPRCTYYHTYDQKVRYITTDDKVSEASSSYQAICKINKQTDCGSDNKLCLCESKENKVEFKRIDDSQKVSTIVDLGGVQSINAIDIWQDYKFTGYGKCPSGTQSDIFYGNSLQECSHYCLTVAAGYDGFTFKTIVADEPDAVGSPEETECQCETGCLDGADLPGQGQEKRYDYGSNGPEGMVRLASGAWIDKAEQAYPATCGDPPFDPQAWQLVMDACTDRGFQLCSEDQYKDAYQNNVGTVPSGGTYAYTSTRCSPAHDGTEGHRLMSGNSGSVWGCHSDIGCWGNRYFRCCTADASGDYDPKYSLYTLATNADNIDEAVASDAWESQAQNVKLKSSYMTKTLEGAASRYFKLEIIKGSGSQPENVGFAIQQSDFKDLCSGEYCRNGYCNPEAPQCPDILGKNEIEYECQCTNPLWETEAGTGIGPEDAHYDLFVSDTSFTTKNGPCNKLTEVECAEWASDKQFAYNTVSVSYLPTGCIWNSGSADTTGKVYFNAQEDLPCGSGGWRCVCSRENCQENEYCYAGECLEREKVECVGDGITPNQYDYDCHCGPTALCSPGQYCQEILGEPSCSDTYTHNVRDSISSSSAPETIRICNDNEVIDGCVCSDIQNCNSNGKAICNREHFMDIDEGRCYDPIETKEKCLTASSFLEISEDEYPQYSPGCIVTDSELLFSTGGNFDCQEDAKCICKKGQCEEPSQCSHTNGLVPNTEICRCRTSTNCFGDNMYCDETTVQSLNAYYYLGAIRPINNFDGNSACHFKAPSRGVCRDSAGKYPAWGWSQTTDEKQARKACQEDATCQALWKHSNNEYQYFCTSLSGVCSNAGNGGDALDLAGDGTQSDNHCIVLSPCLAVTTFQNYTCPENYVFDNDTFTCLHDQCESKGFITIQTEDDCKAAANEPWQEAIDNPHLPHGCIVKDGKTWWNSNANQIACGTAGAECKCSVGCAAYPRCLYPFTGTECQCGVNVCEPDEYCYLDPMNGGRCKKYGYCEDVSGDDQLTSTCMCGETECGAGSHCFESIETAWSLDFGVCNSLTEENCELVARHRGRRFQRVTRSDLPHKCTWNEQGEDVIYWNEATDKTCGASGYSCLCSGAICKPHGHCDNQDGIDPILKSCSCGMKNDCSSPYVLKDDGGSCESDGKLTITDIDECLSASNDIGFSFSQTLEDRRSDFVWSCSEADGHYCTDREPLDNIPGSEDEIRSLCAADPTCKAYDYLESESYGHTCNGNGTDQTDAFNYKLCKKVNDTTVGCFRQQRYHPNNLEFGSPYGVLCDETHPCICRENSDEFCHYDSCRSHPKCDHLDGDLPTDRPCSCGENDCNTGDYCSIHLKMCSPTGLFPGYVVANKIAVDTAGPTNLDPCTALGLETIVHHNQETYKFRSSGKCSDEVGWTYVSPNECRDVALPSITREYAKNATYGGTNGSLPYGCSLASCYTNRDELCNVASFGTDTSIECGTGDHMCICKRSIGHSKYKEVTTGKCTDEFGYDYVRDQTECAQAALYLGWSDTSVHVNAASYYKPGCYFQTNSLFIGTHNDADGECNSQQVCACKNTLYESEYDASEEVCGEAADFLGIGLQHIGELCHVSSKEYDSTCPGCWVKGSQCSKDAWFFDYEEDICSFLCFSNDPVIPGCPLVENAVQRVPCICGTKQAPLNSIECDPQTETWKSPEQCVDGLNEAPCVCKGNVCGEDTGLFCHEDSGRCSEPACVATVGLEPSESACFCGSEDCLAGEYCILSMNKCHSSPQCRYPYAKRKDSEPCACGRTECEANQYCLGFLHQCSSDGYFTIYGRQSERPEYEQFESQTECLQAVVSLDAASEYLSWPTSDGVSDIFFSGQGFWKERLNLPTRYTLPLAESETYFGCSNAEEQPNSTPFREDELCIGENCILKGPTLLTCDNAGTTSATHQSTEKCICGINICDQHTGYMCNLFNSECSRVPDTCSQIYGKYNNSDACKCGSIDCNEHSGLLCNSALSQCSKDTFTLPGPPEYIGRACDNLNGPHESSFDCICGTAKCSIENGYECNAPYSTCTISEEECPYIYGARSNPEACKCGIVNCNGHSPYCNRAMNQCQSEPEDFTFYLGIDPSNTCSSVSLEPIETKEECERNKVTITGDSLSVYQDGCEYGNYKVIGHGLCEDDPQWSRIFGTVECGDAQREMGLTTHASDGTQASHWGQYFPDRPTGCVHGDHWAEYTPGHVHFPWSDTEIFPMVPANASKENGYHTVCKRTEFKLVKSGTCSSNGYETITDKLICMNAAQELSLTTVINKGSGPLAGAEDYGPNFNIPYGCVFGDWDAKNMPGVATLSTSEAQCGDTYNCICKMPVRQRFKGCHKEAPTCVDIFMQAPTTETCICGSILCEEGYLCNAETDTCEKYEKCPFMGLMKENNQTCACGGTKVYSKKHTGTCAKQIETTKECFEAALLHGGPVQMSKELIQVDTSDMPTGCYVSDYIYFNLSPTGPDCSVLTTSGSGCLCDVTEPLETDDNCPSQTATLCSGSQNQCKTIAQCSSQDGKHENDGVCACGDHICDSDTGFMCSSGQCSKIERCFAEDSLTLNIKACVCGTDTCSEKECHNKCSADSYCTGSTGFCSKFQEARGYVKPVNNECPPINLAGFEVVSNGTSIIPEEYCHLAAFGYPEDNFKRPCGRDVCFYAPECSNEEGYLVNNEDCQCKKYQTNHCGPGEFCSSTCHPTPLCTKLNAWYPSNDCSCGAALTQCDRDTSPYCLGSKSQCLDLPMCKQTDGLTENDGPCYCGEDQTRCEHTGLYCHADISRCSYRPCQDPEGLIAEEEPCACGTNDCGKEQHCYREGNYCGARQCSAKDGLSVSDEPCICNDVQCNGNQFCLTDSVIPDIYEEILPGLCDMEMTFGAGTFGCDSSRYNSGSAAGSWSHSYCRGTASWSMGSHNGIDRRTWFKSCCKWTDTECIDEPKVKLCSNTKFGGPNGYGRGCDSARLSNGNLNSAYCKGTASNMDPGRSNYDSRLDYAREYFTTCCDWSSEACVKKPEIVIPTIPGENIRVLQPEELFVLDLQGGSSIEVPSVSRHSEENQCRKVPICEFTEGKDTNTVLCTCGIATCKAGQYCYEEDDRCGDWPNEVYRDQGTIKMVSGRNEAYNVFGYLELNGERIWTQSKRCEMAVFDTNWNIVKIFESPICSAYNGNAGIARSNERKIAQWMYDTLSSSAILDGHWVAFTHNNNIGVLSEIEDGSDKLSKLLTDVYGSTKVANINYGVYARTNNNGQVINQGWGRTRMLFLLRKGVPNSMLIEDWACCTRYNAPQLIGTVPIPIEILPECSDPTALTIHNSFPEPNPSPTCLCGRTVCSDQKMHCHLDTGITFDWSNTGVLKDCEQFTNELGPYKGSNTGGWLVPLCEIGRTTNQDCSSVHSLSYGQTACRWGRKLSTGSCRERVACSDSIRQNENSQDCWCTPDSLCDISTGRMCGPNEAGNQLVCSHQRCPDVLSSDTIIKTCECTPRADIYGNDCNNDFCYYPSNTDQCKDKDSRYPECGCSATQTYPCTYFDGIIRNSDILTVCTCGNSICLPNQYCNAEFHTCSDTPVQSCPHTEGINVNTDACLCDSETCGDGGYYCNATRTENKCHKKFCADYDDVEALCDYPGLGNGLIPNAQCGGTSCSETDRETCCKPCIGSGVKVLDGKCRALCSNDICQDEWVSPPLNVPESEGDVSLPAFIATLNKFYTGYCQGKECQVDDQNTCCVPAKKCSSQIADVFCSANIYTGELIDTTCPQFECDRDTCCVQLSCNCDNGLPATGRDCPNAGDYKCRICNNEYWLDGIDCRPTRKCKQLTEYEILAPGRDTDRICASLRSCNSKQYESVPPTNTTDRECARLTECLQTEYITKNVTYRENFATPISDRECTPLIECNSSQYESTAPNYLNGFWITDRECEPYSPECLDTEYESVSPGSANDRICQPYIVECSENQYESAAPNEVSDRECTQYSPECSENQYESVQPTNTTDRECLPLSTCSDNEYISVQQTYDTDLICEEATTCSNDQYESVPLTENADRTCVEITECSIQEYELQPPTETTDRVCQTCDPSDTTCKGCIIEDDCTWEPTAKVIDQTQCSGKTCIRVIINSTETLPALRAGNWYRLESGGVTPFNVEVEGVVNAPHYSYFEIKKDQEIDVSINGVFFNIEQDCLFEPYTWGQCSNMCGPGHEMGLRGKKIQDAKHGGLECDRIKPIVARDCIGILCPIDCEVQWDESFGECDTPCGKEGLQYKNYTILVEPKYKGKECPGPMKQGCVGIPLPGKCDCRNRTADLCGVCGGDDSTCKGCDGVPNSGYRWNACGDCAPPGAICKLTSKTHLKNKQTRSNLLRIAIPVGTAVLLTTIVITVVVISNKYNTKKNSRKKREIFLT